MFIWVDNFLIDKIFQPVANKIQLLTGRNCFFLTRFFLMIMFLSIGVALFFGGMKLSGTVLLMALNVLNIAGLKHAMRRLPEYSEFANPLRIILVRPRILATMFLVADVAAHFWRVSQWVGNIGFLSFICLWLSGYFMACTPLPPQKSWARETVEKLKAAFSGTTEPVPEPAKS
jgi:hypothetical protein